MLRFELKAGSKRKLGVPGVLLSDSEEKAESRVKSLSIPPAPRPKVFSEHDPGRGTVFHGFAA